MTIWELTYPCDGTPTGFACEFFTSKREAGKRLTELKRETAADYLAIQAFYKGDGEGDAPVAPVAAPEHARINRLKFTGTPKQMVLKALRHGS